jgi:hypothetical protein
MSFTNITKLASSVANFLDDNEKMALPLLATRVRRALNDFPDDPTIRQVAGVLSRMSDRQAFITRAELKKIYQSLYSRNTRFTELFAEEIGHKELRKGATYANDVPVYKRDPDGSLQADYARVVDPVMANALASALDPSVPLRSYSPKAGIDAVRKVSAAFHNCGIDCRTAVADGNEAAIIVHAAFETPKGATSVYVPVEIVSGTALDANCFISNRGSEELNANNIKSYLNLYAGNQIKVRAVDLLAVIDRIRRGSAGVSSIELAITRMKTAATKEDRSETGYFANGITGIKVEAAAERDVQLHQFKDERLTTLADKFDTPGGRANFKFGERKVITGRKSVEGELMDCGYRNFQVAVADCTETAVTYAVNLGKTAFHVPVSMTASSPMAEMFICNGSVRPLNRANIEEFMKKEAFDFRASAATSPLYGSKPSELIEVVRQAMTERNFVKAEDALNILSQMDAKAHETAMIAYLAGLSKTAGPVQPETQCPRIVRNAHSKFPICGHTGLPTHKVYQDKNGDCQPMYRKGMEESYEGAIFNTSKIFF